MSKTNVLIIALAGLIIAIGGVSYLLFNTPLSNDQISPTSSPNTNEQQIIGIPQNISIPAINVNAAVNRVGLAADGSVDVPKGPHDTAWFQLGPRPGEKGSAVITGHYGPWRTRATSVFDNLNKLKKGDKIYIKDDKGKTISFVVRETKIYSKSDQAPEVFNREDGSYLNLITCSGDWLKNNQTYTERLVVFTDLENINNL